MEEILAKLLSSELLNEETKTEISEAWQEAVDAKVAELREEVALEVRAELAEQFVAAREALVEKVEAFVAEQLTTELADLKDDIERFRDLEAEYAIKLVEEKQRLAEEVETEIDTLVDKIDAFLEVRLVEEIEEFKEDIEVVKQNDFGRRVFEAFVTEYSTKYVDEASVQSRLAITESKLVDATKRMQEVETEKAQLIREQKLAQVLAPLSGSKREQMAYVLQNVETQKLEEAYKYFIGRILKESVETPAQTSTTTITENQTKAAENIVATGDKGNDTHILAEAQKQRESEMVFLKRIAGISS